MLPLEYDIKRYAGDSGDIKIRWNSSTKQVDGSSIIAPVSLAGGEAKLSIIKNISEGVLLTVDGVIDDPVIGEINFPLTKEDTIKLLGNSFRRNILRYDIQFRKPSGVDEYSITTLLYGKLEIDGDITRITITPPEDAGSN